MSIFARLGYDSANTATQPMSAAAITTMSRTPPLLNAWQQADAGVGGDTTGYFVNPNATVVQNTRDVANTIVSISNQVPALSGIVSSALNLQNAGLQFTAHCDRLSGVVQPNTQTATLPHYNTAVGISKVVMQIVFQTDGVQNNAPMMGNFTSVTCTPELNSRYSTISSYPTTISNSIFVTNVVDPDTGTTTTTYHSNLSSEITSTIYNTLQSFADYMNARRTGDVNFFNNCQAIAADYNTLKQFSNPGQTETDLLTNHIGSPKLLSRLNS
jgi:hypothetical protein